MPNRRAAYLLLISMDAGNVYFVDVGNCPFYIGKAQYAYWQHTQLIINVIEGTGGTFSLEGPEGKAFYTRSRVFDVAELTCSPLLKSVYSFFYCSE